jgi:hypothetical protein
VCALIFVQINHIAPDIAGLENPKYFYVLSKASLVKLFFKIFHQPHAAFWLQDAFNIKQTVHWI